MLRPLLQVVCVVVAALLTASCSPQPSPGPAESGVAQVVEVVDGDTVVVRIGNTTESVRLIGIDTPEVAHPPEPAECFGPEAAAYLHSLLPVGTMVEVARDQEARDAYDRLLAYLTRTDDGLNVNLAMVEQGFAETLSIAPNNTNAASFSQAQSAAKASGIGLWAACGTI